MKFNFALIAIAVVAAFVINVARAAPLPPAHMQDIKSAVVGLNGINELQARSFRGFGSGFSGMEDLSSVVNQRLTRVVTHPSAGPSNAAGNFAAGPSNTAGTFAAGPSRTAGTFAAGAAFPNAFERVHRIWQVDPYLLKDFNEGSKWGWKDFNKVWLTQAKAAHERGLALPLPPPRNDGETPKQYAQRLFLQHTAPVQQLRQERIQHDTQLAGSSVHGLTTAAHSEIDRALRTDDQSWLTPLAKVIRTYQASPGKLKTVKDMDSKAWRVVNHSWQKKNRAGTLRPPPPAPVVGETAEEYALRLSRLLSQHPQR